MSVPSKAETLLIPFYCNLLHSQSAESLSKGHADNEQAVPKQSFLFSPVQFHCPFKYTSHLASSLSLHSLFPHNVSKVQTATLCHKRRSLCWPVPAYSDKESNQANNLMIVKEVKTDVDTD